MSMAVVSEKECKPLVKMEELFCNFTPDAAVVMAMLVATMDLLVKKEVLTNQDVFDISVKLGEMVMEVQECLSGEPISRG